MSAFIVSKGTVLFVVAAAMTELGKKPGDENKPFKWQGADGKVSGKLAIGDYEAAAQAANMIWQENVKNVTIRYPHSEPDKVDTIYPEDFTKMLDMIEKNDTFDPIQVWKATHYIAHQFGEYPGSENSEAESFLTNLRASVEARTKLPRRVTWGYDSIYQHFTSSREIPPAWEKAAYIRPTPNRPLRQDEAYIVETLRVGRASGEPVLDACYGNTDPGEPSRAWISTTRDLDKAKERYAQAVANPRTVAAVLTHWKSDPTCQCHYISHGSPIRFDAADGSGIPTETILAAGARTHVKSEEAGQSCGITGKDWQDQPERVGQTMQMKNNRESKWELAPVSGIEEQLRESYPSMFPPDDLEQTQEDAYAL